MILSWFFNPITFQDFFWGALVCVLGQLDGLVCSKYIFDLHTPLNTHRKGELQIVYWLFFLMLVLVLLPFNLLLAFQYWNYLAAWVYYMIMIVIFGYVIWYMYVSRKTSNYGNYETREEVARKERENTIAFTVLKRQYGYAHETHITKSWIFALIVVNVLFVANIGRWWFPTRLQDAYIQIVGYIFVILSAFIYKWIYPMTGMKYYNDKTKEEEKEQMMVNGSESNNP